MRVVRSLLSLSLRSLAERAVAESSLPPHPPPPLSFSPFPAFALLVRFFFFAPSLLDELLLLSSPGVRRMHVATLSAGRVRLVFLLSLPAMACSGLDATFPLPFSFSLRCRTPFYVFRRPLPLISAFLLLAVGRVRNSAGFLSLPLRLPAVSSPDRPGVLPPPLSCGKEIPSQITLTLPLPLFSCRSLGLAASFPVFPVARMYFLDFPFCG